MHLGTWDPETPLLIIPRYIKPDPHLKKIPNMVRWFFGLLPREKLCWDDVLIPHAYSYNYIPYTPTLRNRVPEILRKKSWGLSQKKVQSRKVLSTQKNYTNLLPLYLCHTPKVYNSFKIFCFPWRHLHYTKESSICLSVLQD